MPSYHSHTDDHIQKKKRRDLFNYLFWQEREVRKEREEREVKVAIDSVCKSVY